MIVEHVQNQSRVLRLCGAGSVAVECPWSGACLVPTYEQ